MNNPTVTPWYDLARIEIFEGMEREGPDSNSFDERYRQLNPLASNVEEKWVTFHQRMISFLISRFNLMDEHWEVTLDRLYWFDGTADSRKEMMDIIEGYEFSSNQLLILWKLDRPWELTPWLLELYLNEADSIGYDRTRATTLTVEELWIMMGEIFLAVVSP